MCNNSTLQRCHVICGYLQFEKSLVQLIYLLLEIYPITESFGLFNWLLGHQPKTYSTSPITRFNSGIATKQEYTCHQRFRKVDVSEVDFLTKNQSLGGGGKGVEIDVGVLGSQDP